VFTRLIYKLTFDSVLTVFLLSVESNFNEALFV